jgi:hypothetical protein
MAQLVRKTIRRDSTHIEMNCVPQAAKISLEFPDFRTWKSTRSRRRGEKDAVREQYEQEMDAKRSPTVEPSSPSPTKDRQPEPPEPEP